MKERALKIANDLYTQHIPVDEIAFTIRRLVEELEQTKRKYKNMHNLATQAMSRVHQLEKERSE